jgi:hypothetical protein
MRTFEWHPWFADPIDLAIERRRLIVTNHLIQHTVRLQTSEMDVEKEPHEMRSNNWKPWVLVGKSINPRVQNPSKWIEMQPVLSGQLLFPEATESFRHDCIQDVFSAMKDLLGQ